MSKPTKTFVAVVSQEDIQEAANEMSEHCEDYRASSDAVNAAAKAVSKKMTDARKVSGTQSVVRPSSVAKKDGDTTSRLRAQ